MFIKASSAMKKLVILILSLAFLCSYTELRQLFKMPLLIEHYKKHCSENGDISFLAFLRLHYSEQEKNDNDEQEDNQLPFKQVTEKIYDHIYITTSDLVYILLIGNTNRLKVHYSNFILTGTAAAIFHPPRIC